MDNEQRNEIADRISAKHGCEILPVPGAGGRIRAIMVTAYHQRGFPRDAERIAACRAELEAAGISTEGWTS